MNENQEAQALARWLEEHPGQAPPPDVDPEVIEALYALRPDLAPPADVRIDDILASIESGPFATARGDENEVTEEVVSLAAERAKRVPNEVAPASQPPVRRASWWSAPGMGALAAAALALVVILPTAGILLSQKTADLETATPAASAPAPAQEIGADAFATPSLQGAAAPERAAAPAPEDAPAAAEPRARLDSNEVLRQEAKKSDGMEDDRAAGAGLAAPADAAKPATVEGERDAEALDLLEEQMALEKTQPDALGAKMKSEEAEPAKQIEAYGANAAGPSASSTRSNHAKDAAPAAAPASPPAEAVADESATPAPYGDISSASSDATLATATDDSDDRKAMTAAWFLAERQYGRGDPDAAMATIAKGLRRSGNDDLRSDLTALQWTVAQSMRPTAAPLTDDQ